MLRLPLGCAPVQETRRRDGKMGRWEEEEEDGRRSAVLPVAVGHGILSLLLLEELCDGQQLFQHVLHMRKREFRFMCVRAGLTCMRVRTRDMSAL